MKPIHYFLISLALILIFFSIKYWDKITAWWNSLFPTSSQMPTTTPKEGDTCMLTGGTGIIINGECISPTAYCNREYKQAEAEWAKSGKACILTIEEWVCPYDKTFTAQVNPCVGKILQGKGWKPVSGNENPSSNNNNNNNNSSSTQLQVYNSNGAFMYYQSDLASGGKLYSKSNVLVPFGTKFNMIKFWQTNTSNLALDGFYQTDYNQYGASGGFFRMKDIIKK